MRFPSSTLLSLIILFLHEATAQRLVIFAGPRKTSETSVEEFFYSYAHGPTSASSGFSHQQALKHWIWPQIHSVHGLTTTPHQIYGHLITDVEDFELQDKILEELRQNWDRAKETDGDNFQGMIIGSEEFDRVGPNPYSDDDAVFAAERVMQSLGIFQTTDVTIVLLYRTPRLDQWLGIFDAVPFDEGDASYQNLLCDQRYRETYAWDLLQNAMNPLRVARMYALQGFQVRLLDLTGLEQEGLDVEHVIGCKVLNGECDDDGFLVNLRDESFLIDTAIHDSIQTDFAELTSKQEADLEKLFLLRDCAYDFVRQGEMDGVSWEYQTNSGLLENGCTDNLIRMANRLEDTDYFINILQSQVDCNEDPVSIKAVLDGSALPITPSPTDPMEEEEPASPPDTGPSPTDDVQNPTDDEPSPTDDVSNPTDDVSNPTDEEQDPTDEIPNPTDDVPSELDSIVEVPNEPAIEHQAASTNDAEKKKSPLFFLILLAAVGGIAFVIWKRRSTKRRHPRDLVNTPDFELQPALEESIQDWTKQFD